MVIDRKKENQDSLRFEIKKMSHILRENTVNKKTNHSAKYDQHLNANTSGLYGDF